SAGSEHPGRFALIDTDGSEASKELLGQALLQDAESQLALREGEALCPRLSREPAAESEETNAPALYPDKTVLITGATGALGVLVARHLVEEHGARHLLLVSRSGKEAKGAEELEAELTALGAEVSFAACDVSDRKQLEALIDQIPSEYPLDAVIHAAGVLADATIDSITDEQIKHVFSPKAKAAWNLHELTKDRVLSTFVLFSSAAGIFGSPGQGTYAAANSFLDALAQQRQGEGLPATSIAWGLWGTASAMTDTLSEADLARLQRTGVGALSEEQGLGLFDDALSSKQPLAVALDLHPQGLRSMAQAGALPAILSGLVRVPAKRAASTGSLAAKLSNLSEVEREAVALDLVRGEVAAVLGHGSAADIDPTRAFQDLGFDSLAAVELRNRLSLATGLELPATLVFDYPTSAAISGFLLSQVGEADKANVESEFAQMEQALTAMPADDPVRVAIAARLRTLLTSLESKAEPDSRARTKETLETASDDELLRFIDEQVESVPEGEPTASD
ncbi:MAG TPA: beta-ketoacyl reductase, partial [Solirubrobacterales bacterium]